MKLEVLILSFKMKIPLLGIMHLFASQPFDDMLHFHKEKYNWQYWCYIDGCETKALPMPEKYAKLMLAIWIAINHEKTKQWYFRNRDFMLLHPSTKYWIEEKLSKL